MKVVCSKCRDVVDTDESDFCPKCGESLKNAIVPSSEKELLTYTALKNQYDSDKKELFIYLILLGVVLFLGISGFLLEKIF